MSHLKAFTMKNMFKNLTVILYFSVATVYAQPINSIIPFASGFNDPVCMANAGDSRLFVVCKGGYIYITDAAGITNPVPFLDIDARVKSTGSEQGLLGLAFHPQYPDSAYFYVNYIGVGDSSHISRFTVNPATPDVADAGSEKKLLTLFQPHTNHNGGDLQFGPDGYLYIGLGDGGSGGDPGNRAQNLQDYLGKMLRIDVDHGDPYAIPESNPFYNNPSALPEIWAFGLRNPWRFSFDRLTGDLWIGDVGQGAHEEIDLQDAASTGGENYGWRCYEGNFSYNPDGCGAAGLYTFPVTDYSHSLGCSVTGGYVYRGTQFPGMVGKYFYADYCSGRMWTLEFIGGIWTSTLFSQFSGNNFTSFGEDAQGRLYVACISTGNIYLISDGSENRNLNLNVYLEGPFAGNAMSTGLNAAGVIPLQQPFDAAPWNYNGDEMVDAIPNADVVDWVLVEMRDAPDANSATSGTTIARQAGFLLSNGKITGLDGETNLPFINEIANELFVVIWHRNHLGIMSADPLTLTNNTYSYNFTNGPDQIYGDALGHKEIAPGIYGMIAGDSDANGLTDVADKTTWMTNAGLSGYSSGDFEMDAETNNADKNDYLIPNQSKSSQVPE
jgi:glucose/arabinose dehydrogenase